MARTESTDELTDRLRLLPPSARCTLPFPSAIWPDKSVLLQHPKPQELYTLVKQGTHATTSFLSTDA